MRTIERDLAAHARRVDMIARRSTGGMGRTGHHTAGAGSATNPYRKSARDAQQLARTHKTATSNMARAWKDLSRVMMMEERRVFREKQANIKRLERETARAARQQQIAARQAQTRFARGAARTVTGGIGRVAGGLSTVAGLAGGGLMMNAAMSEARLSAEIAGLANQAYREKGAGSGRSRQQLYNTIRGKVTELGGRGHGSMEVAEGLRKFVSTTGDLDVGMQVMPGVAETAAATGASVADVAEVAAQSMQALQRNGIGGAKAVEDLNEILSTLAAQGKLGSIEFRDLASQMSKLSSSTDGFQGDVVDMVATMGAAAQIAKTGGASSTEEAMTAIMRMRDDMISNAGRFKKQGINVFADKGKTKLRDPFEILQEAAAKTGGDLTKTSKLFGIRGAKAGGTLIGMASSMGGGDIQKGIEEMSKVFNNLKNARMSDTERRESAAFALNTPGAQAKKAMDRFNTAVGQRLLPALTKVIPELEKLIPVFTKAANELSKFINWMAKNPWKGIGVLVGAQIAADIAAAGVGKVVEKSLTSMLAQTRLFGNVPGAGGAAASGWAATTTTGASTNSSSKALTGKSAKGMRGKLNQSMGAGMSIMIAAASISIAAAQFDSLTKDVTGRDDLSVNPFADKHGNMGVGATLNNLLGAFSFGLSEHWGSGRENTLEGFHESFKQTYLGRSLNAIGATGVGLARMEGPSQALKRDQYDEFTQGKSRRSQESQKAFEDQQNAAKQLNDAASKISSAAGTLEVAARNSGTTNREGSPVIVR